MEDLMMGLCLGLLTWFTVYGLNRVYLQIKSMFS